MALTSTKLRPPVPLHIALADLDFSWYPHEVLKVQKMWQTGAHIEDIAEAVNRNCDEVAILLIDLARRGKIQRRRLGIYGGELLGGNELER